MKVGAGFEGEAGGCDGRRKPEIGSESKTGRLTVGASWRLIGRCSRKIQCPMKSWKLVRR